MDDRTTGSRVLAPGAPALAIAGGVASHPASSVTDTATAAPTCARPACACLPQGHRGALRGIAEPPGTGSVIPVTAVPRAPFESAAPTLVRDDAHLARRESLGLPATVCAVRRSPSVHRSGARPRRDRRGPWSCATTGVDRERVSVTHLRRVRPEQPQSRERPILHQPERRRPDDSRRSISGVSLLSRVGFLPHASCMLRPDPARVHHPRWCGTQASRAAYVGSLRNRRRHGPGRRQ